MGAMGTGLNLADKERKMNQTMVVFVSGIAGVFVGMGLLYGAIKLNTFVTELILRQGGGKD